MRQEEGLGASGPHGSRSQVAHLCLWARSWGRVWGATRPCAAPSPGWISPMGQTESMQSGRFAGGVQGHVKPPKGHEQCHPGVGDMTVTSHQPSLGW